MKPVLNKLILQILKVVVLALEKVIAVLEGRPDADPDSLAELADSLTGWMDHDPRYSAYFRKGKKH